MPYTEKKDRHKVQTILTEFDKVLQHNDLNCGDLNYIITSFCKKYLKKYSTCYANLNALIGMLECVKQEFYRRVASPYEDVKIKTNGDVE